MLTEILFYSLVGALVFTIIALVFTRNLTRYAFLFFLLLTGIAVIFAFAGSSFLAVTQIILYVGGVLTLILFGIMLSARLARGYAPQSAIINPVIGTLIPLGLFAFLVNASHELNIPTRSATENTLALSQVEQIGYELLTHYLFSFEALSIFLLIVLIAAAYLTRGGEKN